VVRREGFERRIVPARDRVEDALDRLTRAVAVGLVRRRGREDAPSEQEGALDLLVGRHGKRREAFGRGELGRRDQEPRLADAGLALERQGCQPSGPRKGKLLPDRAELDLPSDH
jgi:hypothetical protein